MQTMIREASLGVFLAMVLVPLAMAGAAIFAGWRARRQAQLLAGTQTSPVGMAADGYCKFQGTVEAVAGETVVAPLTGSPCCWYSARVERWARPRTGDVKRFQWQTVRSVTSSAPFFVRDSTGVCAVRACDAEITPTDKSQWTGATLEPTDRNPSRVGPSQSTHGFVQVSGGPNSQFRYSEERIYAGDPLLVIGAFASHRFEPRELDELPPEPEALGAASPAARVTDADDEDDEDNEDTAEADAWAVADRERYDTLWEKATAVTKAEIGAGGRGKPLIVTTTTEAAHVAMTEMGSQAAFMVALIPLGIAALVVLVRFQ
ncbi:MAG: hypothetical protein KA371_11405 [Acidobacteria bacterium]|nr:hypothetical protein [Acidobacteriota bacterium]